MNILLFHPKKDSLEMIAFCLESQMGLQVRCAVNFQEAIDLFLEEGAVDLVITSQQPETDKLFKFLLSTGAKIPVILIGTETNEKLDAFPEIQVLGQLKLADVPDRLLELIRTNFGKILNSTMSEEYCRIKTELLVRVVPLRGDIYIRLSNVKFVKLFRAGAKFTGDDLERFLIKRKVAFLYIKKSESNEFVQKFREDIAEMLASATAGDPEVLNTVAEVQDLIQELSQRIGFNAEVQEIAKSNIQLAVKAIGASPKLSKILSGSKMSSKNYISSHSVLLSNIACSIATLMEWPSSTTFQKLVLAALFHDFVFQDVELAKIGTLKQLEEKKDSLSAEDVALVKTHPIKCAEIIKTVNEIPGDVDVIVAQHHERPDGSGFPKGIRANHISPLSAVFIISHDILNQILAQGDKFDLKAFLKNSEVEYANGPFRKTWKVLVQMLEGGPAASNGSSSAA
jgi:HD-GYP domain-containing protein (c-di-GMP phosphodiesterase class II)